MKTPNKEKAVAVQTNSMLTVIERAVSNKDFDVEKLERLFALQERMLAKKAEQEFNESMQRVQGQELRVIKDAKNPVTNSSYATLQSLNKILVPIYTDAGFSISFGTADCPIQNHYRITAMVSHRGGHSRNYQCDIPIDDKGMKGNDNKTKTHAFGSTMSYGRRYLTLLIFNIALVDDDGNAGLTKEEREAVARKSQPVKTVGKREEYLPKEEEDEVPMNFDKQESDKDATIRTTLLQILRKKLASKQNELDAIRYFKRAKATKGKHKGFVLLAEHQTFETCQLEILESLVKSYDKWYRLVSEWAAANPLTLNL
jgi:hypothetical protein